MACGAVGCSVATGAVVVVVSFAGASSDASFLVNLEKNPMSRASVLCRASFQNVLPRKKVLKKVPKEEEYFNKFWGRNFWIFFDRDF